jgi:hypothetical protein
MGVSPRSAEEYVKRVYEYYGVDGRGGHNRAALIDAISEDKS